MSLSFLHPLTFHFVFQLPGSHLLSLLVHCLFSLLLWAGDFVPIWYLFGTVFIVTLYKSLLVFSKLFQACTLDALHVFLLKVFGLA